MVSSTSTPVRSGPGSSSLTRVPYGPYERCEPADGRGGIFAAPDRARHRDEIGSRGDQWRGIVGGDAADRDAGQLEDGGPPAEARRIGVMPDRLGAGWIEGAEGDVIRAGRPCLHREVATVMTGHADLRLRAEDAPRLARIAVLLAE